MGLASNIDLNGIMEQPKQHTGSFKLGPQVDIDIPEPEFKRIEIVLASEIYNEVEPVNKIEDDDFTIKRKK